MWITSTGSGKGQMAACLERISWFYKVQRTLLTEQVLNYQEGFPLYLGTVSEYLYLGIVSEYLYLGTVSEYMYLGTVSEYLYVGNVSEYLHLGTVSEYLHLGTVSEYLSAVWSLKVNSF
jgi:hypothetical protein